METTLFSIGEFSRITVLSIKSLRLYHEKGILIPAKVDPFSGYRYYGDENFETAKVIKILRQLDFSLAEIKEIIQKCHDEADLIQYLEKKQKEIQAKMARYSEMSHLMEADIKTEKEVEIKQGLGTEIIEKQIDTIRIAGYRMRGRYDEVGKGFQILRKKMGLFIAGKPMTLYYPGFLRYSRLLTKRAIKHNARLYAAPINVIRVIN